MGPNARPMSRRTSPLVLVVEDCDETRHAYAAMLADHGYHVVQAANGADALLRVQTRVPDLVVTDIDMPVLDGIALSLRLRSHRPTAQIPIVVVTGSGLNVILQRAKQAGCDACLMKPCTPARLRETI